MGKLIWKDNGWYIDGTDKLKAGDRVEIKAENGQWAQITVGVDANGVYHAEPASPPFAKGMEVRRPE